MKITVLGNYGPYPKAGGACSGFLIDDGDSKILLDCGNGVLSRLQQYIDIEQLTMVILSHLHSDHISDVMILRYAVDIKIQKGLLDKGITVYAPSEPADEFEKLRYKNAIDLIAIEPEKKIITKDLTITFKEMVHGFKNYAISIEKNNKKFVYSGDTSPNDNLIEFAKGADLFLCEAGLLERDEKCIRAMHLTSKEAGEIASKACVKRLLLTHFLPDIRIENYLKEAGAVYNGIMEMAGENRSYFI